MKIKLILTCTLSLVIVSGFCQKKKNADINFGEVTAQDFEQKIYSIDSNAQAVILYDGGSAIYKSDNESWFNILYTYTKRVRLLNKNAFDLGTVEIPLYKSDQKEDRIDKLEAATYNIDNGVVTKTKIDKESLFNDKASKEYSIRKFTLPNLREGCIIEYRYTVVSPVSYHLRGWTFQDKYPVLKSSYEVTVPTLFDFVFLNTGYYDLKPSVDEGFQSFNITYRDKTAGGRSEVYAYDATTLHSKWLLSDLPAMVKESYTTTMKNHISAVEFQLHSINYPGQDSKPFLGTWEQLGTELMKDKDFGAGLFDKNGWLEDDLKNLRVAADYLATAKNIFAFVRDNFTCTDESAVTMDNSLKQVFTSKKGNVAEINLLLTAMLMKANISAEPALLSTTDHGHAYELYPLINKFNYVITKATINNKQYLLDASVKRLGFNRLPQNCYNGYARTIGETLTLVPLMADSIKEAKTTTIFISNVAGTKKMSGSFNSDLGYFESLDLRDKIAESGKEDFFKKIKSGYVNDIDLSNEGIDSLTIFDERASVHYDFGFELNDDIVYYNPLLSEAYKTNPFKSATRNYPVEMPSASDELIVFNMDIPAGYRIDELPKSEKIRLNDADGFFEYLIQADAETVQLRCRLQLNKATFDPEDYSALRDFFAHVVKKQSEQIVFKKK